MYTTLLIAHSLFRWMVVAMLTVSVGRACVGYYKSKEFTPMDNALRHWTATAGHIQLIIGVILYIKSPVSQFFWTNDNIDFQHTFFAVVHTLLMFSAIVILTIGSALAKRKSSSREKFKTILTWFILSVLIILIAIPWPFSPLSSRPYYRY